MPNDPKTTPRQLPRSRALTAGVGPAPQRPRPRGWCRPRGPATAPRARAAGADGPGAQSTGIFTLHGT
eukprot:9721098-Alexandrium_andersonii.AAC.1